MGVNKRTATSLEVILEVWTSVDMHTKPTHAYVSYDKVSWVNGDAGTITMTFDNTMVESLFIGSGYNYGRFMTFRGAQELTYVFDTGYDGESYTAVNPGELIQEYATSIAIVAPYHIGDWRQAK